MHARVSETVALRMTWLRDVAKPGRVLGKLARTLLTLGVLGHIALFLVVLAAGVALLRVDPPLTALMVYRQVTARQTLRPVRFVPLRQIPRPLPTMVIRLEDYRFYQNPGIDLGALRDAWEINASLGRTVVGGSTITMQLARNLFLTPRKTYFRKYMEALIALELDLLLPKDRILELYLNCIEWGRGVFGIGAASAYYYGTTVNNLSLDQLRRLATIITNPLRFNVETFGQSRQMSERYAYLVSRFPDPEAAPADEGPVAPIPDVPAPEAQASGAPAPEAQAQTAAADPPAPAADPPAPAVDPGGAQ